MDTETPRNKDVLKKIERDIAEVNDNDSDENELLRRVLYEANAEPRSEQAEKNQLLHFTEGLLHTVKWQAAHQVKLNQKLRRLTGWAWVFGGSAVVGVVATVVGAVFQVISTIHHW